jgi:hypothetical protein
MSRATCGHNRASCWRTSPENAAFLPDRKTVVVFDLLAVHRGIRLDEPMNLRLQDLVFVNCWRDDNREVQQQVA